LGLQVAEWLVSQGAGQLLLMGRRAPTAEASARIEHLRARGVRVRVLQGDVADADLVALGDPADLPLRGFVHAAGIVDDGSMARLDPARLAMALRPKADGAQRVLSQAAAQALDMTVFFSSGSSVLGSPGQSTYAGANAFLDGLAHRLQAEGHSALSVNWGAWAGGGMAAQLDERTTREWASRGVGVLTHEQAFAMLEAAIASGVPQVAALPIEWSRLAASLGEVPALIRELVSAAPVFPHALESGAAEVAAASFADTLRALPSRDRLPALTDRLRREAAAVLGAASAEDLELNAGLMEQGMDSLMAVDLSGRLGRALGVSLPSTFAFDHPTLTALAKHLLLQLAPPEASTSPASALSPSFVVADDDLVLSMSEAELEAELRRELDQAGF
jgi:acyl carrier protein/short-subunit dehydrogenase